MTRNGAISEPFCRGFVTEARQAFDHSSWEVSAVPGSPSTVIGDPQIAVSMVGNVVVLRPQGRLDLDSTHALVAAVDAASETDTTVVIDLDGSADEVCAELARRRTFATPSGLVTTAPAAAPTIGVIAPGCVRLSSPHNHCHWTIDLTERRFCRSAQPVDRRFVGLDDWTSIRNVWAARDGVGVVTGDDSIIATATPWVSVGAA